ncbi:PH domain-containing protein [Neobacillus pocheonensis]|uniref:PH domain-containing protein n=1 Tax=Neobacillus pocheonensis TaxID=363869 RepID=A0ABT0W772_9BACI|nr:PH domain-containing protein [Neobacillus pocheonensis]
MLVEKLHKKLEQMLEENLKDETIHIKLAGIKGKEALICTDRRVLIIKTGYYTGGTGFNQFLYSKITSADVKVGFLGAYFELGLGGNQNRPLNLYTEASKLPNCVTLQDKKDAQKFRDACNFILEHIEKQSMVQPVVIQTSNTSTEKEDKKEDIIGTIERLAKLYEQNFLTEEEFKTKKADLLNRL